jgi:hypothetical protein
VHTMAAGGGGVGPPGVGLGKGTGVEFGDGDAAATEGDVLETVGLLPQATATSIRAITSRFTSRS